MIRDWKTTLTSVVGTAAVILAQVGVITLTVEQQAAIVAVALLLVGIFAADSKKEGT